MYELLETINSPADLKKLSIPELEILAKELRAYIIDSVSKTWAIKLMLTRFSQEEESKWLICANTKEFPDSLKFLKVNMMHLEPATPQRPFLPLSEWRFLLEKKA